jgi:hypothetical protein
MSNNMYSCCCRHLDVFDLSNELTKKSNENLILFDGVIKNMLYFLAFKLKNCQVMYMQF